MFKRFYREISSLTHAIRELSESRRNEFEWFKSHHELATKQDLKQVESNIMSEIKEFAAKVQAFNERKHAAIVGIQGHLKHLTDTIEKFQSSPGAITPADQALLDNLEADAQNITTKLEALDGLHAPPAPVE